MPKIFILDDKKYIEYEEDKNLMDILLSENIFLDNACNGKGICGKCKIKIIDGDLEEISETEKNILKEEEIKNNINSFIVRKGAHMFLFCVLGILFFGSVYNGDNILKSVFIALLLAFLYACSDEYHQTFVVGRTGQFNDVLIDFSGAFIGVLIVSLIVKFNIFKKKIQITK